MKASSRASCAFHGNSDPTSLKRATHSRGKRRSGTWASEKRCGNLAGVTLRPCHTWRRHTLLRRSFRWRSRLASSPPVTRRGTPSTVPLRRRAPPMAGERRCIDSLIDTLDADGSAHAPGNASAPGGDGMATRHTHRKVAPAEPSIRTIPVPFSFAGTLRLMTPPPRAPEANARGLTRGSAVNHAAVGPLAEPHFLEDAA